MSAQKSVLTAGSMFAVSQKTGLDYVLKLDPDRLLSPCYTAMGKTPKAATYGGWESQQIQGHSLGHYLSALSGFVYYTGNEEAQKKLNYTISCIKDIQRDDGYFGGIPSTPFDRAFSGTFTVERFNLAGWWVPWYSVHKIYAGLIDAYTLTGNKDALDIVIKMADWAVNGSKNMTHDQFQHMLYCEQGGMCKVFADLYEITGNKEYLTMAQRFIDEEVMVPAMNEKDALTGFHANTQIPKFIGLAKLYDLTGKEEYRRGVEFFFNTVTQRRSYVIGGNSKGEHFGVEYQEKLANDTCETCNTYNMLELSEYVFKWNPSSVTADFYERALYNHILSSQDPDTGCKTYFVSLDNGGFKVYGTFEDAFWCCTGTGMENPERYGRFIAKEYKDTVYINLFINSIIETKDGYRLSIETEFPYSGSVKVSVLKKGKGNKSLKIRNPYWNTISAETDSNGYIILSGDIQEGDTYTIDYGLNLHIQKTRDKSNNFSILYGPVVLAADYGKTRMMADIVSNQTIYLNNENIETPSVTGDIRSVRDWVKSKDLSSLTFTLSAKANSWNKDLTLKPFYSLHHVRYSVYFNANKKEEDSGTLKYKKITVDSIECGRQQSEVDHSYSSTGTVSGYIDEIDSSYRCINEEGGNFGYKVKIDGTKKLSLIISVYGREKGSIDIILGGNSLDTVSCTGDKEGICDIEIPLSEDLIKELSKGKKATRVRLELSSALSPYLKICEIRVIERK